MDVPRPETIALRSLRYFWRSHLAVGLGVAVATAIIVGALVVGDSVRGSLQALVAGRLANVELILHRHDFFDPKLMEQVDLQAIAPQWSAVPLIWLTQSSADTARREQWRRASQIQVLGIDERLISLLAEPSRSEFPAAPGPDEVIINRGLATELDVAVGDEINLRLSQVGGVPADNPLGRRDSTVIGLPRQKVIAIVSDEFIGGFQLHTNQEVVLNAFVSLAGLQDVLDVDQRVNAVWVLAPQPSRGGDGRVDAQAASLSQ